MLTSIEPFLKHIRTNNSAHITNTHLPFFCSHTQIGWISPSTSQILKDLGYLSNPLGFSIQSGDELIKLSDNLAKKQVYISHNELFDVRSNSGNVLGQVDRGAIPVLGLAAEGVHINGLVRYPNRTMLWVAKRSMSKRLDPGKLDHIVAGGISAGLTPFQTVIKEAQEEANIPYDLARRAQSVGKIHYSLNRPEGLRRDILHCYDLLLPSDFQPVAQDGEVDQFFLLPIKEVFNLVKTTEDFKFNVNLVLIDLFVRLGLFKKNEEEIVIQELYKNNDFS